MSHSHQHGSDHGCCDTANPKVDVSLSALTESAPVESSLPARILAKSREVASQSGHKAVYTVGMDVGSTTVKAVVVDPATDKILWQDYQRHDTKQPEKVLEFLKRMQDEVGIAPHNCRIFITGSRRRRHGEPDRRKVRAGSQRRIARGREALSRSAAR